MRSRRHHTCRSAGRHHVRRGVRRGLPQSAVIRAIFKGRELMLGSAPMRRATRGCCSTKSLGWGVSPRSPVVSYRWCRHPAVGATWCFVRFRQKSLPFNEPDYVKIAWTLRADPLDARYSMARSETRRDD